MDSLEDCTNQLADKLSNFVSGEADRVTSKVTEGMIHVNIVPHHCKKRGLRSRGLSSLYKKLPSRGMLASRIF